MLSSYRNSRYSFNGFGGWLTDLLGMTPGMKAYDDAVAAGVTVSDIVGPTPTSEGLKALDAAKQVATSQAALAAKVAVAAAEAQKQEIEVRAKKAATSGATSTLVIGAGAVLLAWLIIKKR